MAGSGPSKVVRRFGRRRWDSTTCSVGGTPSEYSRRISIPANRSLHRPAIARFAVSGPAPRRPRAIRPGGASRPTGSLVVARLRAGGDRGAAGQRLEATHVTLRPLLDALGRNPVAFDLRGRLPGGGQQVPIGGLPGWSGAVLAAWLAEESPQRLLTIISTTPADAER